MCRAIAGRKLKNGNARTVSRVLGNVTASLGPSTGGIRNLRGAKPAPMQYPNSLFPTCEVSRKYHHRDGVCVCVCVDVLCIVRLVRSRL